MPKHSIQVLRLIAFSASQSGAQCVWSVAEAQSAAKNVTKVNPWM